MTPNDENRNADRTSDLVRRLLQKAREDRAPAASTDASRSDAIARVLRQVGKLPEPPEEPIQRESDLVVVSSQSGVYPIEESSASAPPPIKAPPPIEAPPLAPPPVADFPEESPKPKKEKRAKRESKKGKSEKKGSLSAAIVPPKPERSQSVRGFKSGRRDFRSLDDLPDEAGLSALASVVASPVFDPRPEEFLASASIALGDAPDLGTTLSQLSVSVPDSDSLDSKGLLAELEDEVDEQKVTADALELVQDQTALEKAANDAPMWLASLCVHLALVVILALIAVQGKIKNLAEIVSEPGFGDDIVVDEVFDPSASVEIEENLFDDPSNFEVATDVPSDVPDVSAFNEDTAESLSIIPASYGAEGAPFDAYENLIGTFNGDDLSGRGKNKGAMILAGGGNEGSEKSVALALSWLAEHQLRDGSWSFNNNESCGLCRNSGSTNAPLAATAMGVLPFLAAGHTPTQGKYKKVVASAINFLTSNCQRRSDLVSFREQGGTMYSHGLATIAICETYAMLSPKERKRYRELGYIAQGAINYIEYAQADNGGWRYEPKQAGDTSVAGWQIMALKSGQMAGLNIQPETVFAARNFLRDIVGYEDGTHYGYTGAAPGSLATDSIGLLCRLYMDWGIEDDRIIKGSKALFDSGPKLNTPYYTYYAMQLMYNVGGEQWTKWNARVRDDLIKTQCQDGHERGSWYPDSPGGHCASGGRLYVTSLNCMCLEVYYRHMPLYQKINRDDNFLIELPAKKQKK
ncbi:MAG: hypothetical protein IJM30_10335 [Thermoguttaceae bacterium]|nr:hypothetical protein [Thermoguttaceae bacterium]